MQLHRVLVGTLLFLLIFNYLKGYQDTTVKEQNIGKTDPKLGYFS